MYSSLIHGFDSRPTASRKTETETEASTLGASDMVTTNDELDLAAKQGLCSWDDVEDFWSNAESGMSRPTRDMSFSHGDSTAPLGPVAAATGHWQINTGVGTMLEDVELFHRLKNAVVGCVPPSKEFRGHEVLEAFIFNLRHSRPVPICTVGEHTQEECRTRLHILSQRECDEQLANGRDFPILVRDTPPLLTDAAKIKEDLFAALKEDCRTEICQQDLLQGRDLCPSVSVDSQLLHDGIEEAFSLTPGAAFGFGTGNITPKAYLDLPGLPCAAEKPLYSEELRQSSCLYRQYQNHCRRQGGHVSPPWQKLPHLKPGTGLAFPLSLTGAHQDSGAAPETTLHVRTGYKLLLLHLDSDEALRRQHRLHSDTLQAKGAFHLLVQKNERIRFAKATDGGPVIHSAVSVACGGGRCVQDCVSSRPKSNAKGEEASCKNVIVMSFEHFFHPRHLESAMEAALCELQYPHITNTDHGKENLHLFEFAQEHMKTSRDWWERLAPEMLEAQRQDKLLELSRQIRRSLGLKPRKQSGSRRQMQCKPARGKTTTDDKQQSTLRVDAHVGPSAPAMTSRSGDGVVQTLRSSQAESVVALGQPRPSGRAASAPTAPSGCQYKRPLSAAPGGMLKRTCLTPETGVTDASCLPTLSSVEPVQISVDLGNTNMLVEVLDSAGLRTFVPFGNEHKLGAIGTRTRVLCGEGGEIAKVCGEVTDDDDPAYILCNLKMALPSDDENSLRTVVQEKLDRYDIAIGVAYMYLFKHIFEKIVGLYPDLKQRPMVVTVGQPSNMDDLATEELSAACLLAAREVEVDVKRFVTQDEAVMAALYIGISTSSRDLRRILLVDMGGCTTDCCGMLTRGGQGDIDFIHVYHRPRSSNKAGQMLETRIKHSLHELIRQYYPEMEEENLERHLVGLMTDLYEKLVFPVAQDKWVLTARLRHNMRGLEHVKEDDLFSTLARTLDGFVDEIVRFIMEYVEEDAIAFDKHSQATVKSISNIKKSLSRKSGSIQNQLRKHIATSPSYNHSDILRSVCLVGGGFTCNTLKVKIEHQLRRANWNIEEGNYDGRTAVVKGLSASHSGLRRCQRLEFLKLRPEDLGKHTSDSGLEDLSSEGKPRDSSERTDELCKGAVWMTQPWNLSGESAADVVLDDHVEIYRFSQDPTTMADDDPDRVLFAKLKTDATTKRLSKQWTVAYPSEDGTSTYYSLAYCLRWQAGLFEMVIERVLPPLRVEDRLLEEKVIARAAVPIMTWGSF